MNRTKQQLQGGKYASAEFGRYVGEIPIVCNLQWEQMTEIDNNIPLWYDGENVYGSSGGDVVMAGMDWESPSTLFSVPSESSITSLLVTQTGKILIATRDGNVYKANEARDSASLEFAFDGGYCPRTVAHGVKGPVCWMGAYDVISSETYNHLTPPREVYLSGNNGNNWRKIFQGSPTDSETQNYHIHDVEYDSNTGTIWVLVGDGSNRQVHYSNDLGNTWNNLYPPNTSDSMLSQVVAFPHGICFGSDSGPDRIMYLPKNPGFAKQSYSHRDMQSRYFRLNTSSAMIGWATRRWTHRGWTFMGWTTLRAVSGDKDVGKILCTKDGYTWHVIYETAFDKPSGIDLVLVSDDKLLAYGWYSDGANVRDAVIRSDIKLPQ